MAKLIEIDDQTIRELKDIILKYGSTLAFAKKINVVHTTVRDWIRGKTRHIRSDVFANVRQIIDEQKFSDQNIAKKIYCGKVLKSVRLIRGIYGPEIQDKLGISTNSLYDYERGRSFPKAEYADRLFGYLGIDQKIFRDICEVNFSSGVPVDQTAKMILNGKAPERKTEEAEDVPDEYDAVIVSAVKCGLKNLTEAEKTILFRMIVNFTTAPVKKEYFHE